MRLPVSFRSGLLLACAGLLLGSAGVRAADDLAWPPIGREQKPWTRWWWPGSAVDPENLTAQLRAIAQDGLGGVEITPIYGAKGAEARFIPFLSPKYMDMLRFTVDEARVLDLGVDMATGTGWPFGGPWVGPADVEQKLGFSGGQLAIKPTGFKVKRSAPGGAGPVLNPFSAVAMEHYLEPFTRALSTLPPGSIHAQFHDSYEYTASWASEVPERFRAMHGYDIHDQLEALAGRGDPDTVARVKGDYRETLGALHYDYVHTWVDWSRRMGSLAREQAHGAPGNLLDLYALADVPETEIFGSTDFPIPYYRNAPEEIGVNVPPPLVNRMASSAAHVAGLPLASSETFTWLREHFHVAPSEMKPELDQLLLAGINRVYYHGNAYSPADAPWPGWLFYAATQENTRNSLWEQFGWVNAYIARAQSLLQSGRPDNDLLVYWPVYDIWHDANGYVKLLSVHLAKAWMDDMPCGALARQLVAGGYTFDYISDAQLNLTQVRDGALTVPGGTYRSIVVPRTGHMPVATLERLLALARDGATVIFVDGLPADVPGFGQLAARRAQLKADLAALEFHDGDSGQRMAAVGQGRVIVGPYGSVVGQAGAARESIADSGVGVLRRQTADGELYFLANLTAKAYDGWTAFGHGGEARGAVLFEARSGRAGVAALRRHEGRAEVYLQLQPGESIFVKLLRDRKAEGAGWAYAEVAGPGLPVTGTWNVTFLSGGPVLPPPFAETTLASWTAQGGDAERFAGTARYDLDFMMPPDAAADDWMLDLGDLREAATVKLNGAEIDRIWALPFQTRVGAHLQSGKNHLSLEVTNLSANRIRDLELRQVPWKNFYEINFVDIHYMRFNGAKWPLQPAGLLGPVQLIPLKSVLH
jgi:hypothetical protein